MSVGVIIRKVRFIARTLCVILKPQYHVCANIPFHSTDCMHKTVLKVGKCFLSFQTFETSFLSTSLQNCQLSYQLYVWTLKQREKSPTVRRKVRKLQLFQPQCSAPPIQTGLNLCSTCMHKIQLSLRLSSKQQYTIKTFVFYECTIFNHQEALAMFLSILFMDDEKRKSAFYRPLQ